MKLRTIALSVLALTLSFVFSRQVHGQTQIQYFSSFAKPGQPIPQACLDEKAPLVAALNAYPHPAKWTYLIACDDTAWEQVKRHVGADGPGKYYGFTDFDESAQLTYLKGTALLQMDDSRTTAEHVIAHELCHIYLHSHDEGKVDKLATSWVEAQHRNPGSLIATATLKTASTN